MPAKLIQSSRRNRREYVVQGYITNNGTAAIVSGSRDFTVVRNGAGDLTVTFLQPGRRFLSASVLPINTTAATGHFAKLIAAPTASAIQIGTYVADATDGAPADIDFCFQVSLSSV